MTRANTPSIPIPANTKGVPASSYGPTSPSAGTSPLASFGAHSTSPQNASYLSGSGRKSSGNVFQSFARQLTAFLPNTYPIGEQDEDAEAKAKRHGKLRILLLENINVDASDFLKKQGYEVSPAEMETETKPMSLSMPFNLAELVLSPGRLPDSGVHRGGVDPETPPVPGCRYPVQDQDHCQGH